MVHTSLVPRPFCAVLWPFFSPTKRPGNEARYIHAGIPVLYTGAPAAQRSIVQLYSTKVSPGSHDLLTV